MRVASTPTNRGGYNTGYTNSNNYSGSYNRQGNSSYNSNLSNNYNNGYSNGYGNDRRPMRGNDYGERGRGGYNNRGGYSYPDRGGYNNDWRPGNENTPWQETGTRRKDGYSENIQSGERNGHTEDIVWEEGMLPEPIGNKRDRLNSKRTRSEDEEGEQDSRRQRF